jgi:hypothetical protein
VIDHIWRGHLQIVPDTRLATRRPDVTRSGDKEGLTMTHQFLRYAVLPLVVAATGCTAKVDGGNPTDPMGPGSGGSAGSNPTGVGGSSASGGKGSGGTAGQSSGGTGGSLPGAGTGGTSSTLPDPTTIIELDGTPQYFRAIRLTNEQWTNSVQSVLRLPEAPTLAESFSDAVTGTTDFDNNELVLSVDARGWTDFQAAAETLAAMVTADAALLGRVYSGSDAAGFITTVGRRVYRRPLTPAEVTGYQTLFDTGAALSGDKSAFAKGAMVVLEAMLQSPYFLYRTELGAAGTPLSTYEVAAKLSLWLRNTTPDDALLDAAATTSLATADGVALAAQQMLEDPAAKAVMRDFHGQFLHFNKFAMLSKSGVATYDPAINPELEEASYLFFDRLFSQGQGVADMFLSTSGFVGNKMAALLDGGAAPPAGTFVERDFTGSRRGFFTQLPFLVLNGRNATADPIHRGVTMALDVLCLPLGFFEDEIPPLPARKPGQTNRTLVDEHTGECGLACHKAMINPLGFAFENFDGMGQYREMEVYATETLPIDASGTFELATGVKTWQDADGFMQVLASDPQSHMCYSKKLASYALQREVSVADAPLLTALASTSVSGTGSIKQLMLTLVKQDAFRTRVGGVQ